MRLILLGPPGSGKGTQAKLLCPRFGLVHIGTGDILREAVRRQTQAGKLAEPFVVSGRLVPDSLVNDLVADHFRSAERPDRFVMDGYPRTLAQATAFDAVLRPLRLEICTALLFVIDDAEIIRRLSGRWSCPKPGCKATYHVTMKPPRVAGRCDDCGTALIQRDDDREETIRKRLQVYHQNLRQLRPHYESQGILREVPADGEIQAIFATIVKVLEAPGHKC
jgi:adenylate kinase